MAEGKGPWGGGKGGDEGLSVALKAAIVTGVLGIVGVVIGALIQSGGGSDASKDASGHVTDLGGGPTPPTTAQQKLGARLQVVATRIVNAPPPDDQPSASGTAVDMQLQNTGDTVSSVTAARFVVRKFTAMPEKSCGVSYSYRPVTHRYDLRLPPSTSPGTMLTADTNQDLKPNDTDRFRVDLGFEDPPSSTRIYQLGIDLVHDKESEPVNADTVVVAVPWPKAAFLLPATSPGISEERRQANEECAARNAAILRRAVEAGGTASTELQELIRDPRESICHNPRTRDDSLCE
jgi:hypothetical protein